jgi:hypothetical protein
VLLFLGGQQRGHGGTSSCPTSEPMKGGMAALASFPVEGPAFLSLHILQHKRQAFPASSSTSSRRAFSVPNACSDAIGVSSENSRSNKATRGHSRVGRKEPL